jgi:hypothetical protein
MQVALGRERNYVNKRWPRTGSAIEDLLQEIFLLSIVLAITRQAGTLSMVLAAGQSP